MLTISIFLIQNEHRIPFTTFVKLTTTIYKGIYLNSFKNKFRKKYQKNSRQSNQLKFRSKSKPPPPRCTLLFAGHPSKGAILRWPPRGWGGLTPSVVLIPPNIFSRISQDFSRNFWVIIYICIFLLLGSHLCVRFEQIFTPRRIFYHYKYVVFNRVPRHNYSYLFCI